LTIRARPAANRELACMASGEPQPILLELLPANPLITKECTKDARHSVRPFACVLRELPDQLHSRSQHYNRALISSAFSWRPAVAILRRMVMQDRRMAELENKRMDWAGALNQVEAENAKLEQARRSWQPLGGA